MKKRELVINYSEYDHIENLLDEDKKIAKAAILATTQAYAPYSNFKVGAAVRLDTGELVKGSNQENIAYPSGLCAERTAMFYAGHKYPNSKIVSIAIAACKNDILTELPISPCGACRQVMAEYQTKGAVPISVILIGSKKVIKFEKINDILPFIFDSLK